MHKINIAFDINLDLRKAEEILDKYVETDEFSLFVPNKRFPIPYRTKTTNPDIIRNVPYIPYKCMGAVNSLILYFIYGDTIQDIEPFRRNPYLSSSFNYIKSFMLNYRDDEIVREYVPHMTDDDVAKLINEANVIYKKYIKPYITPYINYVFDTEFEERIYLVKILGHIEAIRFKELEGRLPDYKEEGGRLDVF